MNGLSFTELLQCLAWSSAPLNFNFLFKLLIYNMPCSVVLCLSQCWAMMTEIRCINIRTYCNLYWLFSRKAYKVCSGYNSCREVVIILMTGKEPCWEHFPWEFSIYGSLYVHCTQGSGNTSDVYHGYLSCPCYLLLVLLLKI